MKTVSLFPKAARFQFARKASGAQEAVRTTLDSCIEGARIVGREITKPETLYSVGMAIGQIVCVHLGTVSPVNAVLNEAAFIAGNFSARDYGFYPEVGRHSFGARAKILLAGEAGVFISLFTATSMGILDPTVTPLTPLAMYLLGDMFARAPMNTFSQECAPSP